MMMMISRMMPPPMYICASGLTFTLVVPDGDRD